MPFWIDTHCHLDASAFEGKQSDIVNRAYDLGVRHIVIPSVCRKQFSKVMDLAHQFDHCSYALGIHPLFVEDSQLQDLQVLTQLLEQNRSDSHLVGVGEIGMDYYLPELCVSPLREKMEYFFVEQLKIARKLDLPVLLHTRRCVDDILKLLRRYGVHKGIAHAFSGSAQQANNFIDLGFKISFCATATYERAKRQQQLLKILPIQSIVVETDSPDLPPYWKNKGENSPTELPAIGEILASFSGVCSEQFAKQSALNAIETLQLDIDKDLF